MAGGTTIVCGFAFLGIMIAPTLRQAQGGPVQILGQERTVRAEVNPLFGEPPVVDERSAPDAGPFDATAIAQFTTDGFTSVAQTSVSSTLGPSGFAFVGELVYESQDTRPPEDGIPTVRLDYRFEVTFAIDEPYTYDFRRTFDRVVIDPSGQDDSDHRITGVDNTFLDIDADGGGILLPGTYQLSAVQTAQGLIGDRVTALEIEYDVSLALTPVIPLPPAVWSGLLVLGGAALAGVRTRRIG